MVNLQAQKNANERRNQNRRSGYLDPRSTTITKTKRVRLDKKQKLAICHYSEENPNHTYKEISEYMERSYGVKPSRSVIYETLSMSEKLNALPADQLGKLSDKKAKFPKLENELRKFINDMARDNIAINYLSILTRAEILAVLKPELLDGAEKPELSRGWVQRFMAREGLRVRSMNGEAGSVQIDESNIQVQLKNIREILKDYELKDIYNMDETGLFYRNAPSKTISRESVSGVKADKTRVTIGFFCNADGSSKITPIIIGKHENPRCFKRKNASDFGFHYYSSKKAWMTTSIFRKIIGKFNSRMAKEHRNVVLLIDNAPVHDERLSLSNVKIVFLPPNTTAHYQPLDAGIIANFKTNYRRIQYRHAAIKYSSLSNNREAIGASKTSKRKEKPFFWVDQLQAMNWIKISWEKVTSESIKNCWRRTTLLQLNNAIEEGENVENVGDDVDSVEDKEFDDEENSEIFSNECIIADETDANATLVEEDDDEREDEDVHQVKQEDLVNAMRFVVDNIVAKTDEEFDVLEAFSKMYISRRDEMFSSRTNQTTISSYFSK